ncbi:MAG: RNB domain-containing ribonuclease [Patescibacteria group bacterium]
MQVKNYTHFTSPIRRYADVVIHRILKSILRGEENPFDKEIIKEIANHSNMVRLHIETV